MNGVSRHALPDDDIRGTFGLYFPRDVPIYISNHVR